jgi:NNP family nitrate/nitrite transporter-like MFS transporter
VDLFFVMPVFVKEHAMSSVPSKGTSGSLATVFASFLHFDVCFMIWVMLGSLSVAIKNDLGLNAAQQGLLVAIPVLSGSLMRLPIGLLSDRYSGKWVGVGMLTFLFIPLLAGWLLPVQLPALICVGLLLGVAGSSFAVALPLASRWYPPSRQGLVMGVSAAGNLGTVIANAAAPSLAKSFGWHAVLGMAMIPLAVVLLAFLLLAKDSPNRPQNVPVKQYLSAFRKGDLWWFSLLYSVTFGGFVGLGSFLPQFYNNQFQLSAVEAGYWAAGASAAGSLLRPLGGYLADKFGGVRMLTVLFVGIFGLYLTASFLLPLSFTGPVFILGMACLGMGNGSVFQLVPQRFRNEIGVATGLVGAIGGLGGFALPFLLGSIKQGSGSYASGWFIMALFALVALIVLRILAAMRSGWRTSWAKTSEAEPETSVANA